MLLHLLRQLGCGDPEATLVLLLLLLPRLLLGLGLLLLQKTVDGLLWGDHSLLFCTRR